MVRILGGPLRLNERATYNIFSGWILPSRYEPPANVETNFTIFLNWKNHSVAIQVGETTWHIFPMLNFQANFLFPYVSTPSGVTGRYTLRNFLCMVITFCKSVAVGDFGAKLVLGGNLLGYATFWWPAVGLFYLWTNSQSHYELGQGFYV